MPPLLGLLREFAQRDLAELKDFAATIRVRKFAGDGALGPAKRGPEELRQVVKGLLDRVARAGQQMRAVETVILRYAQRSSAQVQVPVETLRRFLIEFHKEQARGLLKYVGVRRALPKARAEGCPTRARNPFSLNGEIRPKGIALQRGLDETTAYGEAEEMLSRLEPVLWRDFRQNDTSLMVGLLTSAVCRRHAEEIKPK